MISARASLYGEVSIGHHSRVDDFCVLSGGVNVGRYVHIAPHCTLIGPITMHDFSGLSSGVRVYGKSDDYSGEWATNPTLPDELRRVVTGRVIIGEHAIVGTNAVILPGVCIGEGAAIGAGATIRDSVPPWSIVVGLGRVVGKRSQRCRGLVCEL